MNVVKIYTDSFRGLSKESWVLAEVMLINRTGSMVLPFLGLYITDKMGFDLETAGLILSFYGIGSVIGSWLGGVLTDKLDDYMVQSWSLFLSVPLFLAIPFFDSFAGLAFIIFTLSMISECFRPANSVAITKYAKEGNLTRAFSLNRMAVNLGFSLGPAIGGILSGISYNFLFMANGLGALISGIVYVYHFHNKKPLRNAVKKTIKEKVKKVNAYRDVKFLVFSFLCLCFAVCFFQFLNTLPLFYKDVVGLSQVKIGVILGYSGLLLVLIEMLFVEIAEKRFSIGFTLFLGVLFSGVSYGMLGFWSSMPALIISLTLMSVGEIWVLPFTSTVAAMRAGIDNKGAYMGVLGIGFALSFIITPYLGTHIAHEFGFKALWMGTGFFLLLIAIGFQVVTPWLLNKEDKKHLLLKDKAVTG